MPEPEDLEPRVAALESELPELRARMERSEEDAAAARVLAGGADQDVGEMRAEIRAFREQNVRLHNATRADIAGIRRDITGLQDGLAGVATEQRSLRTEFDDLRDRTLRGFAEIRGLLDAAAAGQQRIVDLLTAKPDGE